MYIVLLFVMINRIIRFVSFVGIERTIESLVAVGRRRSSYVIFLVGRSDSRRPRDALVRL